MLSDSLYIGDIFIVIVWQSSGVGTSSEFEPKDVINHIIQTHVGLDLSVKLLNKVI